MGDGIIGEQAGETPGKGADPSERGLAEGKSRKSYILSPSIPQENLDKSLERQENRGNH
jgi:hypothetical protein